MLKYAARLKQPARALRANMTDAEQCLWARLRRKQLGGIQFYRQKPIGGHIVDFHAPAARLAVEVDGSQHQTEAHKTADQARDRFLNSQGLRVLRFDNLAVLKNIEGVLVVILEAVEGGAVASVSSEASLDRVEIPPSPPEIPPSPPFSKGGMEKEGTDDGGRERC
jgi:very-short-patch-repair endonuclease